jgi:hypothetical protein
MTSRGVPFSYTMWHSFVAKDMVSRFTWQGEIRQQASGAAEDCSPPGSSPALHLSSNDKIASCFGSPDRQHSTCE